jgi:hypothetical protein
MDKKQCLEKTISEITKAITQLELDREQSLKSRQFCLSGIGLGGIGNISLTYFQIRKETLNELLIFLESELEKEIQNTIYPYRDAILSSQKMCDTYIRSLNKEPKEVTKLVSLWLDGKTSTRVKYNYDKRGILESIDITPIK